MARQYIRQKHKPQCHSHLERSLCANGDREALEVGWLSRATRWGLVHRHAQVRDWLS
jgi:hypothetical protein